MRMKLTDQAINKDATADGKRRELADAGCPGLRIRITPAGNRSWILGVRDKLGNARRFPLGNFPGMGLADAREAARDMQHKVKRGGADPIADKRRHLAIGRDAKAGVGTLKALLDAYPALKNRGRRGEVVAGEPPSGGTGAQAAARPPSRHPVPRGTATASRHIPLSEIRRFRGSHAAPSAEMLGEYHM